VTLFTRSSNDSIIFGSLAPGNDYLLTVTDKYGCRTDSFKNIAVIEPAVLNIDIIVNSNYSCYGRNNGSIRFAKISGGTRPYEYSVDNGATWQADSLFTDLKAGITYEPMVRDSNQCSDTETSIVLAQAKKVILDSITHVNVTSCFENAEGSLKVWAKGGDQNLRFSMDYFTWQPDSTFRNLLGGTYKVYVQDDLTKCDTSTTVTIARPSAVVIDSIKTTNASGGNNGTITVYAKGGTGSLTYYIYNNDTTGNQTDKTFTKLRPNK
jgi:hypothetical protein